MVHFPHLMIYLPQRSKSKVKSTISFRAPTPPLAFLRTRILAVQDLKSHPWFYQTAVNIHTNKTSWKQSTYQAASVKNESQYFKILTLHQNFVSAMILTFLYVSSIWAAYIKQLKRICRLQTFSRSMISKQTVVDILCQTSNVASIVLGMFLWATHHLQYMPTPGSQIKHSFLNTIRSKDYQLDRE